MIHLYSYVPYMEENATPWPDLPDILVDPEEGGDDDDDPMSFGEWTLDGNR